jgi:hypothetical protein
MFNFFPIACFVNSILEVTKFHIKTANRFVKILVDLKYLGIALENQNYPKDDKNILNLVLQVLP